MSEKHTERANELSAQAGLTIEDLDFLRPLGQHRTYRSKQLIWTPTDAAHSIFVVQRGKVCIGLTDMSGRSTTLRVAKRGEVLDLCCFCADGREGRGTTGVAETATDLLEIPHGIIAGFLYRRPDMLLRLLSTASENAMQTERRMHVFIERSAEARLSVLLVQLAQRHGFSSNGNTRLRILHFTHDELARLAGLSRAHLTVVMGRLRDRELVTYGRDEVMRVDVAALRKHLAAGGAVEV